MITPTESSRPRVNVLLIDDQPLVGETVRRMIAGEHDITFHFCKEPTQAIDLALEIAPTVILLDLVMPEIEGLELVKAFRALDATREVPLIVLSTREEPVTKAEAFALGATDYMVKLPDRLELLARLRHHSKGYINLLQRNEAYRDLAESQRALANDVAEAAKYVRSLLPRPIRDGPVRTDWRFTPSAALGGDTFGYHFVDDEHFAFYLIDVVGHGVGAALLSVSVLNALRAHSLPKTDFHDPGQVLTALNKSFQMEQQADKYFTAWYGVYQIPRRTLSYSGGGHPPALLFPLELSEPTAPRATLLLEASGPIVGAFDDLDFETRSQVVAEPSKVFLYSDGVFEITKTDDTMWSFNEFVAFMAQPSEPGVSDMDRLIAHIRALSGKSNFDDDFSIVELRL